jgi:carbon-monoxide dehydrogenase medium subunit
VIPAAFEYHAPSTLRQAITVLRKYDGDGRVLAGGMSLVPMMKLRLANPTALVDLRRIDGLAYVYEATGNIAIGPMTTHHKLESDPLVRDRLPLLADTAALIGDTQVRNRGTIAGSVAHADPAADLPAALLALEAVFRVGGGPRRRVVPAHRMFVDAYTTALRDGEIITEIVVPVPPPGAGTSYQKLANKASRFAIVGVAAIVSIADDGTCSRVRIAVTGAGPSPVRARFAERYLAGREPSAAHLGGAGLRASRGIECLEDVHGSPAYREHLTQELTQRALTQAVERASES